MEKGTERFPQYLHRPYRILWFEVDEIVLMSVMYMLSMMFSMYILLMIPLAVYLFRTQKIKKPRGFFRHIWYRLGFFTFPGYPDAFEKEFSE